MEPPALNYEFDLGRGVRRGEKYHLSVSSHELPGGDVRLLRQAEVGEFCVRGSTAEGEVTVEVLERTEVMTAEGVLHSFTLVIYPDELVTGIPTCEP